MPKLVSDWVRVAKAGTTIDKRTIQESWLVDAGEQYSTDVYTAVLTLEHYDPEHFGSLGTVYDMKYRRENGKTYLYARFMPNERLIHLNRNGQKIFPSIYIELDFADTGRAYCVQIGLTDKPASLGVQMIDFSAQKNQHLYPGVEIEALTFSKINEKPSPEADRSDKSLLEKIKTLVFSTTQPTDTDIEEPEMNKEELKAAIAAGVAEAFAAQKKEQPAPELKPEHEKETPDQHEIVSADAFNTLKTEHEALKTRFSALEKKLNKELPGTDIDNPGGQDKPEPQKKGF